MQARCKQRRMLLGNLDRFGEREYSRRPRDTRPLHHQGLPMLKRRITLAAGLTLLARAGQADPAAHWTIATEYPANAMPGEGIALFAAKASNKKLTVQPRFDAPDGLRSAAMPQAVQDGTVMAADSFAATLSPLDPIFQLSGLPFLTASPADAARLLELARSAYAASLAAQGLVLLYATPWPPSGLWSRNAVTDLAALKNLRIRTYDSASTRVFAAAGAQPQQISFADALPLLRSGSLDAVLSSGDGGAGARLWETLPHFTAIDYAVPLSLTFCSASAMAALPADTADQVRHAADVTQTRQFAAMATRISENESRMRQHHVHLASAPVLRSALEKHAAPIVTSWGETAGQAAQAILARYRAG